MAKRVKTKIIEPVGEPVNLIELAEENNKTSNKAELKHSASLVQDISKAFDLLTWYAFEHKKLEVCDHTAVFLKFNLASDAHNYLRDKGISGWRILQGHALTQAYTYQFVTIRNKLKNKKN